MSSTTQGYILPPALREVIDQSIQQNNITGLNCHQIGIIEAYDAINLTARIRVGMKKVIARTDTYGRYEEVEVDYPILNAVPVFTYCGGSAFIHMPIQAGDECILLFNDRQLDAWWCDGNTTSAPKSDRTHSLSDAIAIVGLHNRTRLITGTSLNDIVIKGIGGGEIDIGAKIAIKAASGETVKQGLNQLFDALESWVDTRGDSPNPATVAAITLARETINKVLK